MNRKEIAETVDNLVSGKIDADEAIDVFNTMFDEVADEAAEEAAEDFKPEMESKNEEIEALEERIEEIMDDEINLSNLLYNVGRQDLNPEWMCHMDLIKESITNIKI